MVLGANLIGHLTISCLSYMCSVVQGAYLIGDMTKSDVKGDAKK